MNKKPSFKKKLAGMLVAIMTLSALPLNILPSGLGGAIVVHASPTAAQINNMTPAEIEDILLSEIKDIPPSEIPLIEAEQIAYFLPAQIAYFLPVQRVAFTLAQRAALLPMQRAAFHGGSLTFTPTSQEYAVELGAPAAVNAVVGLTTGVVMPTLAHNTPGLQRMFHQREALAIRLTPQNMAAIWSAGIISLELAFIGGEVHRGRLLGFDEGAQMVTVVDPGAGWQPTVMLTIDSKSSLFRYVGGNWYLNIPLSGFGTSGDYGLVRATGQGSIYVRVNQASPQVFQQQVGPQVMLISETGLRISDGVTHPQRTVATAQGTISHPYRLTFNLRFTETAQRVMYQQNPGPYRYVQFTAPIGFRFANTSLVLTGNGAINSGPYANLEARTIPQANIGLAQNGRIMGVRVHQTAIDAARGSVSLTQHIDFTGFILISNDFEETPSGAVTVDVTGISWQIDWTGGGFERFRQQGGTAWTGRYNSAGTRVDSHMWNQTDAPFVFVQNGNGGWTHRRNVEGNIIPGFRHITPTEAATPLGYPGSIPLPERFHQTSGTTQPNASTLPDNWFGTTLNITVGTIGAWAVTFARTTYTDYAPIVVSGRQSTTAGRVEVQSARLRVSETIPHSADADRNFIFEVDNENVIIERVRVYSSNAATRIGATNSTVLNTNVPVTWNETANNNDNANTLARLDNNVLTLSSVQRQAAGGTHPAHQLLSFDLYFYFSVAPDFEGDIYVELRGAALRSSASYPRVVAATAVPAVRVDAYTTNILVGHQFVTVGNFTVTENLPGALLVNQDVFISVSDDVFTELVFAPTLQVTTNNPESSLRISNLRTPQNLNIAVGGIQPQVEFTIEQASGSWTRGGGTTGTPGVISFSNVQVRQLFLAPVSNIGYDLIVWGPAVANNVNNIRVLESTFPLPPQGIQRFVPLAGGGHRVATIGEFIANVPASTLNPNPNLLNPRNLWSVSRSVREDFITVHEVATGLQHVVTMSATGAITVDGNSFQAPANLGSPTLNLVPGSTMIPARLAAATLLGVPAAYAPYDNEMMAWDAGTSTFFIDPSGSDVRVTIGSPIMWVGGQPRTIGSDANGVPIVAQIYNGRTFLPARALAEALGFDVSWDAAAGVATFTPLSQLGN